MVNGIWKRKICNLREDDDIVLPPDEPSGDVGRQVTVYCDPNREEDGDFYYVWDYEVDDIIEVPVTDWDTEVELCDGTEYLAGDTYHEA